VRSEWNGSVVGEGRGRLRGRIVFDDELFEDALDEEGLTVGSGDSCELESSVDSDVASRSSE